MKKSIKCLSLLAIVLTALIIMPLFSACSASGDEADKFISESAPGKGEADAPSMSPDSNLSDKLEPDTERKIIKTFEIFGETKEYDSTLSAVNSSVSEHGGYISASDVTGASYSQSGTKYSRRANLTIKIPAENAEAFVSQIGTSLNVTSSSSSAQDVSEAYFSIEARLKTLETERDSLLAMMASINKATEYDFWYKLQGKISETEQQIAEYEAILRSYDGRISYSTVNLTINEVVEYTELNKEEASFLDRIGKAFTESWTDFGEGCMDFAVFIVAAFPTLLVIAAVPGTILFIIFLVNKRNKKKR